MEMNLGDIFKIHTPFGYDNNNEFRVGDILSVVSVDGYIRDTCKVSNKSWRKLYIGHGYRSEPYSFGADTCWNIPKSYLTRYCIRISATSEWE